MTAAAPLRSICVFGGASGRTSPGVLLAAEALGRGIAGRGIRLGYGGGARGLMGAVARAAAGAGGEVVGIAPRYLAEREEMAQGFGRLIVAPCLHARKRLMLGTADGFVVLPGGIGTLDELAEVMAWRKHDQLRKPVVLANIEGFWTPLLTLFAHLETSGFRIGECLVADAPDAALTLLAQAVGSARPRGASRTAPESGLRHAGFELSAT